MTHLQSLGFLHQTLLVKCLCYWQKRKRNPINRHENKTTKIQAISIQLVIYSKISTYILKYTVEIQATTK